MFFLSYVFVLQSILDVFPKWLFEFDFIFWFFMQQSHSLYGYIIHIIVLEMDMYGNLHFLCHVNKGKLTNFGKR
jgi:hypothetical protein